MQLVHIYTSTMISRQHVRKSKLSTSQQQLSQTSQHGMQYCQSHVTRMTQEFPEKPNLEQLLTLISSYVKLLEAVKLHQQTWQGIHSQPCKRDDSEILQKPILEQLLRPISSGHPNQKLMKPSVPCMYISATNQPRQLSLTYKTDIAYLQSKS